MLKELCLNKCCMHRTNKSEREMQCDIRWQKIIINETVKIRIVCLPLHCIFIKIVDNPIERAPFQYTGCITAVTLPKVRAQHVFD